VFKCDGFGTFAFGSRSLVLRINGLDFSQSLCSYTLQTALLLILQRCFCGSWLSVPFCVHPIGQHGVPEKPQLNMKSYWRFSY